MYFYIKLARYYGYTFDEKNSLEGIPWKYKKVSLIIYLETRICCTVFRMLNLTNFKFL